MARWPTWRQKAVTFERLGYVPSAEQEKIHRCTSRVVQVVGGERAGKSRVTAAELVVRVPWCQRIGIVADEYDEARREFGYLVDDLTALGAMGHTSTPRRGAWYGNTLTGCEIRTVSVHSGVDELTGTGEPFDIIAVVEAGLVGYNVFLAGRGRVAETRGLVLLSGTLWDNVGWYADLYQQGQGPNVLGVRSFSLPSWSNRAIFPGGREDPELLAWREALGEEEAARRIDALVLPSPARVFPQFSQVVHVQTWAEFDPGADVYLAVDAGYYPSRYAVLACQFRQDRHGREVLVVVDEIWEHNKFHEEIIAMAQARPWADHVVQAVGGHETRQHQAAASTQEVWAATWPGLAFEVFDAGLVLEGVRRMRWLLRDGEQGQGPRLVLGPRCEGVAWEFEHYRRPTDRQGNVTSEQPEDRNNDAMDALRNMVVWRYGLVDVIEGPGRGRGGSSWRNPYG